ncbi:hypothetical protein I545_5394 [Mycobacterium kansasii 662]|uniref:Uncharacterized protein n=1 Tax=Mycobacterium kansasii 662 TaxID=1299326 RepID=X7YWX4_MYCKA|nr:hypothetical protein I545_5394 [Mycobacterium kansasii 662]KEP43844.1 hypothetical protein MKSMC1_09200 [Mycobacterium kansasii]
MVLQRRDLIGNDMGIWHATNITFYRQLYKTCNRLAQRG